ncbi:hypothetical protein APS56_04085 [Pseudalgibacter alginicilyticus]|uniref:Uncharacterized protein n=1 Tax=Pseudalgibacter alginicilyticus TaxID=1736674 RepID=A0A0P0D6P0_9FLAO|nr:hypothetical protein [Pseudalgibacter alginicilyticus]ALJ04367.1 hypothetical protein APS56_04085 [Pseudalgibacter alginicilyticus]
MIVEQKKQVLIRVNKTAIENTKKGIVDKLDLLNDFVKFTETILKTSFTDNEKSNLKDEGIIFVKQWIKPKFKFPDADEVFNLQALGIDLKTIETYWKKNNRSWIGLSPELDKGKFAIKDLDKLPEVRRHYYYASNDKQIDAFNEAKEVCKHLNTLLGLNLITHGQSEIINYFKNIRYGTENNIHSTKGESKFYPNELGVLKQ